MTRLIDDVSVAHAALVRLHQELAELGEAVATRDRVMVIDELVDVAYYVDKIREAFSFQRIASSVMVSLSQPSVDQGFVTSRWSSASRQSLSPNTRHNIIERLV